MSRERHKIVEAEAVDRVEGKMCGPATRGTDAPPWSKTPSRPKGMRRNLGDLARPMAAVAVAGHAGKSRRRSRRGTGEESDALHSTDEGLEQSRDGPGIQGVGGGGGRGGKGAWSEEERTAAHGPGSAPEEACHRSGPRTDRGYGPCQWPHPRSRQTFGRSPVRASRTPGSVRGAVSNHRPYRDPRRRLSLAPTAGC